MFQNLGILQTKNNVGIPDNGFKWSRLGQSFQVSLNLAPDTYHSPLGLIESSFGKSSARVFSRVKEYGPWQFYHSGRI